MGRNVPSLRQEIDALIERWEKYKKSMRAEDSHIMDSLIKDVKKHAGEASYALDDPLEAAILSILIEIKRKICENDPGGC